MQSAYGREQKKISMAKDLWLFSGMNIVKINEEKVEHKYKRDTMFFW